MPATPVPPVKGGYVAPPPLQKPSSEEPMPAPPAGVSVRMYRQGLGDCFLLAFPTADPGKPYYALIDCGLFQKVQNQTVNLTAVAEDIRLATGGEIHLLVITHRHADHISGFRLAHDVFSQITFHNLWLSWAERPEDDTARQLWSKSAQAANALTRLAEQNPVALAPASRLRGFDEPLAGDDPFAVLGPVRALLAKEAVTAYYQGGDGPLALPPVPGYPAAAGARIYVLGPPTNLNYLAQMNPQRGNPDETYLVSNGPNAQTALMAARVDLATLAGDARAMAEISFPFDSSLRISQAEAQAWPDGFFREHYGFEAPPDGSGGNSTATVPASARKAGRRRPDVELPDDAAGPGAAWRRVDDDWLGAGEALALQLDNVVNNTTLALAVELVNSRKVLMLVGDAQVGNWLSWHDLKPWDLPAEKRQVTVADLLQRTVLYKVGHHGSSNATVIELLDKSKWGFGLMADASLVAMLPVDENFAKNFQGWQFPDDKLWQALESRTNMRVLRLDKDQPVPPAAQDNAWQAFMGHVKSTPLWVQYTLTE